MHYSFDNETTSQAENFKNDDQVLKPCDKVDGNSGSLVTNSSDQLTTASFDATDKCTTLNNCYDQTARLNKPSISPKTHVQSYRRARGISSSNLLESISEYNQDQWFANQTLPSIFRKSEV